MSWDKFFKEEEQKEYYKKLMTFVENEYQTKVIFPLKKDMFNAFALTKLKDVKVVILGQDPYHDMNQAHGLSFSVQDGIKIPPSLRNIYTELLNDLGILPSTSGDLTSWAKEGVLLLNTILTVEAHKPLSHKKRGWEVFTDRVIEVLNDDDSPKVFILWGNNAITKKGMITNSKHLVITSSHPSPLSARHSFFGSKVFSRTNQFLQERDLKEINFTIKS